MTNVDDIHSYGIDVKNREIYLHSYISSLDEDPGVDYRMACTFTKNLRILDFVNKNPIVIHMHSIGGNVSAGMAIFDSIKMCKSYVTIIAYGQAESMSSLILQAADYRLMTNNSYFMCHFGSFSMDANVLDVINAIDHEKRCVQKMLNIYVDSALNGKYFKEAMTRPTRKKVESFIKHRMKSGDWYLDAEEAVYYGFADDYVGSSTCKFS
jgi:ATP-dependent protease ClpP protease subunit